MKIKVIVLIGFIFLFGIVVNNTIIRGSSSLSLSFFDFFLEDSDEELVFSNTITDRLSLLDLDDVDNVMVVAHPDDEMIWGGAHLISEKYLVVCVTCGSDSERVLEFENVMAEVNAEYIMLGYPDLTDGKKDTWENVYDDIASDVLEVLNYKNWQKIVTHNPDGEYGHIHHQMTSSIVTTYAKKNNLYYFGIYYEKDEIGGIDCPVLQEELLARKEETLTLYVSQKQIIDVYAHMLPYENFIAYSDWS